MNIQTLQLGELQTNCYLVSGDRDDVIVIDPGDDAAALLAALDGRHVAGVLITHAHFDHILGLSALPGAPIYVHEADAAAMTDPSRCLARASRRLLPATHTVREGQVIPLSGIEFSVLHTPGHTPGSVCYQAGSALFSGDTLFSQGYGRTDLPGGSYSQLKKSLCRLLALSEPLRLYPGHGPAIDLSVLRGQP